MQKFGRCALLPNRIPETRVLDEIGKKELLCFTRDTGHSCLKNYVSQPRSLLKSFYRSGSRGAVADRDHGGQARQSLLFPQFASHRVTLGAVRAQIPMPVADLGSEIFNCPLSPPPAPPVSFYNQARLGNPDTDEILATGDPV